MERDEILKSAGFSDAFLKALNEFEKAVPNIYYDLPFDESEQLVNVTDTSGQLIVNCLNNGYNHNLIVRQTD
jgi:hypothetical protein